MQDMQDMSRARDVMDVSDSSVNIFRAFSTAVDIMTGKRNKIKGLFFKILM